MTAQKEIVSRYAMRHHAVVDRLCFASSPFLCAPTHDKPRLACCPHTNSCTELIFGSGAARFGLEACLEPAEAGALVFESVCLPDLIPADLTQVEVEEVLPCIGGGRRRSCAEF